MLGGEAKRFLDDENDLVALKPALELDYLSQFLRRHWLVKVSASLGPDIACAISLFIFKLTAVQKELTRDGRFEIGRFEDRSVFIAVNDITIFVAAILLIGSIVGFYYVNNDVAKLTMIAAFTVAFALSVGLMTNARRAEIFAATAA